MDRTLSHLRRVFFRPASVALALLIGASAPAAEISAASLSDAPTAPDFTGVTQALVDLLEQQDKTKITADDYQSTSLQQIVTFGTPEGYRIKLRYLNFGVALVEALKLSRDPELRRRMIEVVQWSRNPQVRAQAILTLAGLGDPSHKRYFKEAILDSQVGIRFAAVEALQLWKQDGAQDLLKQSAQRDWSPLMQAYAAQALLSLGDNSALPTLWKGLDNSSWVVRAMSARYLGDYADPNDYTKLVSYLDRENQNDFVVAELSIAALKLISRKAESVSYAPASPGWDKNSEVGYTLGKDRVVEVEPLVIVPPRLHIPPSLQVAAQINARLLHLIKDRLNVPLDPVQAQDPLLQELNQMVTPSGFALKTRYSELSYLVVEALAGTSDPLLRTELQRLAESDSNPLVRASALLALAYSRNDEDVSRIQDAISSPNATLRMGALEAVDVGRFESALPAVSFAAGNDESSALQVYATQLLAKFGDSRGRQMLLAKINDPDWPARAMAFWYLGRYGGEEDYAMVLSRLNTETNPFVKSEIALAALRLAPVQ